MIQSAHSAKLTLPLALPKRVALINDLTGFGRCSFTAQLPLLSVLGLQCCPVPTAILSNHCGFDHFFFDDYTAHIPAYLAEWKRLQLTFSAVYTGFLGSPAQIALVKDFITQFAPDALILIDPVMGDDGIIPPPYTDALCDKLKQLVSLADVITPNVTEACKLADMPYCPAPSDETLRHIAERLLALGCQAAIITGIQRKGYVGSFICRRDVKPEWIWNPCTGQRRVGTGDLFSSVLLGRLLQQHSLTSAACEAAGFVYKALVYSEQAQVPLQDGIAFEPLLSSYFAEEGHGNA